jgi:uncharacterized protein YdhG (YjbR/CyaY superfamily)
VHLHNTIKKIYPKAEEGIGYGVPLYKLHGHPLCSFKASRAHSGFFPWSSGILTKTTVKPLVKNYSKGAGTVRFPPSHRLPVRVVRAILKTREAEILVRWGKANASTKRT